MAVNKLAIYNNALLLVGVHPLDSLTENVEARLRLDNAYDLGAVDYCLELIKPTFARKVSPILQTGSSTVHGLEFAHVLPADYLTMIQPYSDFDLDSPLSRYVEEGEKIHTNLALVYLRYVVADGNDQVAIDKWTIHFANVVAAYLAQQVCVRFDPEKLEYVTAEFDKRVAKAEQYNKDVEPDDRPSKATVTLSTEYRKLYNDALQIMGLDEITTANDDSNRRRKLDRTLDSGVVEDLLEDYAWTFGNTSIRIDADPSLSPEWGYQYAFTKPNDLHRLDGVFSDEYMRSAVRYYSDESDHWFADCNQLYIKFVSKTFINSPGEWPPYFKRMVAARMAKDAAPSLRSEGADIENSNVEFHDRESKAKSTDAMMSPPKVLGRGSWVNARHNGLNSRNRPGDG